jgi:3-hydroxyisobutyrate dehydrogenase-like beta-hydroxyacid dehydrogenase
MLATAVKLGLAPERMGQVINGGTGRSYASEYFVPRILRRAFSYGFSMEQAYKDIKNLNEAGERENISTPVLDAAASVYRKTLEMGYGHLYKGAMFFPYEAQLGIEVKASETINEI